jgi:hypothetical protein
MEVKQERWLCFVPNRVLTFGILVSPIKLILFTNLFHSLSLFLFFFNGGSREREEREKR